MPKCNECRNFFGFMELKNGLCKQCINKNRPPCLGCKKNFDQEQLTNGYCLPCFDKHQTLKRDQRKERLTNQNLEQILLTTESSPNINITQRLDIISAEYVCGMNLFKDIATGIRDVVGGRSAVTQNELRTARQTLMTELRQEACVMGANAVVAVDVKYTEFSGQGKSMLIVAATGTAVKTAENSTNPKRLGP